LKSWPVKKLKIVVVSGDHHAIATLYVVQSSNSKIGI